MNVTSAFNSPRLRSKFSAPFTLNISGRAEKIIHQGPTLLATVEPGARSKYSVSPIAPSISFSSWLGGYGFDFESGIQGAYERDGFRDDFRNNGGLTNRESRRTVDSQERRQLFAEAGLRLRLKREWGDENIRYKHIFTPRVGISFIDEEQGDGGNQWVDLGFDDERAMLKDERCFLTLGF